MATLVGCTALTESAPDPAAAIIIDGAAAAFQLDTVTLTSRVFDASFTPLADNRVTWSINAATAAELRVHAPDSADVIIHLEPDSVLITARRGTAAFRHTINVSPSPDEIRIPATVPISPSHVPINYLFTGQHTRLQTILITGSEYSLMYGGGRWTHLSAEGGWHPDTAEATVTTEGDFFATKAGLMRVRVRRGTAVAETTLVVRQGHAVRVHRSAER